MSHFFHSDKKSADDPPAYPTPPPAAMSSSGGYQPPHGQFGLSFACLLLSRSDRVRIIGFPNDVVPAVEEAIARVWYPGISSRGPYDGGGYEWKVSGRPCKSDRSFCQPLISEDRGISRMKEKLIVRVRPRCRSCPRAPYDSSHPTRSRFSWLALCFRL